MQPFVEHVPKPEDASFGYTAYHVPCFPFSWHVHPEYELTLITSGRGQRYVGDHMAEFGQGDLVLLGKNLPHTWHSQRHRQRVSSAVVIQFRHDFLGQGLFGCPEFRSAGHLLDQSARGVAFGDREAQEACDKIIAMGAMPPVDRATALLGLLDGLSRCRRSALLSSQPFTARLRQDDQKRIDRVCRLINERFTEPISQSDMAALLHMSPSTFARFFKKMTGQTFLDYVHRLRVGRACRLLIETDHTITDICFDSGFANVSNFNRVFRRLKAHNPRDYRKRFTAQEAVR